ncbi:MAG TPA: hypothetical protein PLL26_06180, partial [Candidatus Dojkabacteria bacterium]|nr:hypothetical protein [Candidatus Dojkabacteria bacterium]
VLLTNVPKCTSISNGLELLGKIGCTHKWQNNNLTIDPTQLRKDNFCFEADSFYHTSGSILLVTLLSELYGTVTIKNASGYTDTGEDPLDRTLEKHYNFIKQYGYKITEENNSVIYEKN